MEHIRAIGPIPRAVSWGELESVSALVVVDTASRGGRCSKIDEALPIRSDVKRELKVT